MVEYVWLFVAGCAEIFEKLYMIFQLQLANASIDKQDEQMYQSIFFFSLGLQKGYLKFVYKNDQDGEKTHILVKTADL